MASCKQAYRDRITSKTSHLAALAQTPPHIFITQDSSVSYRKAEDKKVLNMKRFQI
jgi:hypothetical protein